MRIFLFLLAVFFFQSCQRDPISTQLRQIDFPAAYVVCADNTISVINLLSLSVDTTFNIPNDGASFAHHIYKSPDNQRLVVAMPKIDLSNGHDILHDKIIGGGIITLSTKTGAKVAQLDVPVVNHNAIYSPDGSEIWTALMSHQSPRVLVFDAEMLTLKKEIYVGTDPSEITFSSDGKTAFVAAQESSFVYAIDVQSKELVKQIKVDVYPTNVWPGGSVMYVENDYRKSVNIIESAELQATSAIDLDFSPGFITAEATNERLWICNPTDGEVAVFSKNGAAYKLTSAFKTGEDTHAIAVHAKRNIALVVNQRANTVSVIDLATLSKIKDIRVGKKPNGIVLID